MAKPDGTLCDDLTCTCCHPEMTCHHPKMPRRGEPGDEHECPACGVLIRAYVWTAANARPREVDSMRRLRLLDKIEGTIQWTQLRGPTKPGPY